MSDIETSSKNNLRAEMSELIRLTQLCNPVNFTQAANSSESNSLSNDDSYENYEVSFKKVKLNNENEKKIEVKKNSEGGLSRSDDALSKRLRSFTERVEKFKQTYGYQDQETSPSFGAQGENEKVCGSGTKRKIDYESADPEEGQDESKDQPNLMSSIKKLSEQIQKLKDSTRKDFENFKEEANKRLDSIVKNPIKNKANLKFMNKVQAKMEKLGFIPRVAFLKPAQKKIDEDLQKKESKGFKALPLPHFKPFQIKHTNKHEIKQKAFNLSTEIRGEQYQKRFREEAEKCQKMKSCVKSFKACPLPDYDQLARTGLKAVKMRDATKPKEFNLKTNVRATQHKSGCDSRSNESIEGTNQFKSHPMPDFSKPFVPVTGRCSLTEVDNVVLKSDQRAQRRIEYEKKNKERENLSFLKKKIEEEEKKRNDLKELQDYRKSLVFKAKPIGYEMGGIGHNRSNRSNSLKPEQTEN